MYVFKHLTFLFKKIDAAVLWAPFSMEALEEIGINDLSELKPFVLISSKILLKVLI
jgi:hypothetical protein